jgi:hypothetical protein
MWIVSRKCRKENMKKKKCSHGQLKWKGKKLQKKKQLLHKGGKSHGLREQAREKVWKRREKSLFIDGKVKKKLKKKIAPIEFKIKSYKKTLVNVCELYLKKNQTIKVFKSYNKLFKCSFVL